MVTFDLERHESMPLTEEWIEAICKYEGRDLRKKNDNAGLLPVDSGTYGSEVFSLAQIVKRKINSVVDVTEFIYVIEAQLNR